MKVSITFSEPLKLALSIDNVAAIDEPQYLLCSALWRDIISDACGAAMAHELCMHISTSGLFSVIKSADTFAKSYLDSLEQTGSGFSFLDELAECYDTLDISLAPFWKRVLCSINFDLISYCDDSPLKDWVCTREFYMDYQDVDEIDASHINQVLGCQLLLRFPKRFTVHDPDITDAIAKFKAVHHADWLAASHRDMLSNVNSDILCDLYFPHCIRTYNWPSSHVCNLMRENFNRLLKPARTKYERALREYDADPGEFSSGAMYLPNATWYDTSRRADGSHPYSAQCTRMLATKYQELWDYGYYYDHINRFRMNLLPVSHDPRCFSWSSHVHSERFERMRDVLVSAVPKDYESSRMIAPETVLLNVEGDRTRGLYLQLLSATGYLKYMDPSDQSRNRKLALLGSADRRSEMFEWLRPCTLDESHASDSIIRDMYFEFLSDLPEVAEATRRAISDYMIVDGKRVQTQMLATSGSRITPVCQCVFFMAAILTAYDLAGIKPDWEYIGVYNDDLVVPYHIFNTVLDVLDVLHITVNRKKTFANSLFRESCGGEYILGYDITGKYWPRKALKLVNNPAVIQQLVAMQHRLYDFPSCRMTLDNVVLQLMPKMTFSPVGTDCEDLWLGGMTDYQSMCKPHCRFVTDYVSDGDNPWDAPWSELPGVVEYLHFLEHGPSYASPLDELLGVSSDRTSWKHAGKVPVTHLRFDKPLIRSEW